MDYNNIKAHYTGLNDEEVITSMNKYGTNELVEKKKETIFSKVLHLLKEPIFIFLIIASSVYFVLGEISDGLIMMASVFFVATIQIIQSQKTDKAIEALNILSSLNVHVIRNGKVEVIDSSDIVVDDLIILAEGDKISADGVILKSSALGVDESALTGESAIVYKKKEDSSEHFKTNICYAGTNVVSGSGLIKVIAVGHQTEYGRIGSTLNDIDKEVSPLDKQIKKLVLIFSWISLSLMISVTLVNFLHNSSSDALLSDKIVHALLSGVTVGMATIPEELPVVLTVFLALGALSLTKKNALTRNTKTIESLGTISTLCVDKTGTLTQNKMTVQDVYDVDNQLVMSAILACPKNPYDPMEQAILDYGFKQGIDKDKIYQNEIVHEYIFKTENKMMGQVWTINNENLLYVKGAYESVVSLCGLDDKTYDDIKIKAQEYAKLGYRVIAVASSKIDTIPEKLRDNKLYFLGLIALTDPPRKGVRKSIETCYKAGIRLIMITGDNGQTAKGIASQIGLKHGDNVVTGIQLEAMSDEELKEVVKTTNIFARVYPNHKMRIVDALQANNEVVAMTGDGVNDAPALKKAEVGIAMGLRGTNVAKSAADIVLMDDDFNTIVGAISNGRTIYNNIRKAISYIVVIHIPIALASLLIPVFNLPLLLLPVHIVILELIIDPMASITFQRIKAEKNVMNKKPRTPNEHLITKPVLIRSILQGLLIFASFFSSYFYLNILGYGQQFALTFSFTMLLFANLFVVNVLQSDDYAITNFIDNLKDKVVLLINITILFAILLIIYNPFFNQIVGTVPLSLNEFILTILIAFVSTFSFDLYKWAKRNQK